MKWWGWLLLGAVLALAGAALYTAHATSAWRQELGAAQANSAAADSAVARASLERDQLRAEVLAAGAAQRVSDSVAAAAQVRAGESRRREQLAKERLAQVTTAADSIPPLVDALAEADSTISDQARQLVLLAKDTTRMAGSIAKLLRSDSLAQGSIDQLTRDRDVWKKKAERKSLTEITGKWFLGLPKPGWHVTAGFSLCPVNSVCVTAGYGI